jgi:sulfate transport system ATP-binding protein
VIRIEGIVKGFGATVALRGITLDVARGRLVALQGLSGSGKTTLLRIIAGLEQPDAGTLELDGRPALDLPPGRRGIGFVFQNYALFEHLSVFENVAFGLRVRRVPSAPLRAAVEELLTRLGLPGLGPRRPSQLSGGQRQRVALARALAVRPPILLLDEPFNALDEATRRDLWGWLKRLQSDLALTIVLVTHDRSEAEALADEAVFLESGRIVGQTAGRAGAGTAAVPGSGAAVGWADGGDGPPTPWPRIVPS